MKRIASVCIFLVALCVFCSLESCSKKEPSIEPEQKLLNLFQYELDLLNDNQDDYLKYMTWQIEHFRKKQELTNKIISEINERFKNMTQDEQQDYQLKWNRKFQVVIDQIYERTKSMLDNQNKNLDPKILEKIQELTIKIELMEKETPSQKLLPQFFIEPLK